MFLKNINDITITNDKITVTRDSRLTVSILEEQIQLLEYSRSDDDKHSVIENTKLPPFIQVFYYWIFRDFKLPTFVQMYETYFSWLGGIHNGKLIFEQKELDPESLKARMNRTYPSLIRDIHFIFLLNESKQFEYVYYSMWQDYYDGLDIKVKYNQVEYYISIFIDTMRSNQFKNHKKLRHNYSGVKEIELKVDFKTLTKKGEIFLLNKNHIETLVNTIKQI